MATTFAISTTEEPNIRAGKFSSGKKRKYPETYLEHGFTYCTIDGGQHPQCLICSAKAKEPHIIGGSLIRPVAIKIKKCRMGRNTPMNSNSFLLHHS
jgi:hypothetical protein